MMHFHEVFDLWLTNGKRKRVNKLKHSRADVSIRHICVLSRQMSYSIFLHIHTYFERELCMQFTSYCNNLYHN